MCSQFLFIFISCMVVIGKKQIGCCHCSCHSLFTLLTENRTSQVKMPGAIERCVCKQNIQFMHNRNQFSVEYFQFMRKLLVCNTHYVQLQPGHDKLVGDMHGLETRLPYLVTMLYLWASLYPSNAVSATSSAGWICITKHFHLRWPVGIEKHSHVKNAVRISSLLSHISQDLLFTCDG